jgi:hypothetical protein
MKTILGIWLASLLGLPPSDAPDASVGGDACPPEHRNARLRVGNLLGSPLLPEIRARFDLGTASADDVRLLRNPGDRETCALLWEALERDGVTLAPAEAATFFRSGDVFLVPVSRRSQAPAGAVRLDGRSALFVYDAEFRLVGRFGA